MLLACLSEGSTPGPQDVALHLAGCDRCRERLEFLRRRVAGAQPTPAPGSEGEPPTLPGLPSLPRRLGPYELGRIIGRGGMGVVVEGFHSHLRRRVAVKLLPVSAVGSIERIERFRREMEAIGALDHPRIVRAHDAGVHEDILFLVMELVDGVNLAQLVEHSGPVGVGEACEMIRQAALGLQHAHEKGLVHRDIKPANLLLTRQGEVKLADFGLARLREDPEALTGYGVIMGTHDFMAPEQADDPHHVDIRADLYSLGCTLYMLLTGTPPYARPENNTPSRKLMAHAQAPIPGLCSRNPDVPPEVEKIVRRLMAKRPEDRYAVPLDLAGALDPFRAPAERLGALVPAPAEHIPSPQAETLSQPVRLREAAAPRRRTRRLLLPLAVGVACLAALSLALLSGRRDNIPPGQAPDSPPGWPRNLGLIPEEIVWPGYEGRGDWKVNEAERYISVNSNLSRFIRLGALSGGDHVIRVRLQTYGAGGKRGIFLGYHTEVKRNRDCAHFQAVVVQATTLNMQRVWEVSRMRAYLFPNGHSITSEFGESVYRMRAMNEEPLDLELKLVRNRLASVKLNGEELPELCRPLVTGHFPAAWHDGPWGLYNEGNAWFSELSFQPLKGEN